MPSVSKLKLSGSTDGRAILAAATATPGTLLHTAQSGTTSGSYDELWLWACNHHTSSVLLSIEFGGVSNPADLIEYQVPFDSGLFLVVPGLILQNACVVRAFAGTTNVINLVGFVNRITP